MKKNTNVYYPPELSELRVPQFTDETEMEREFIRLGGSVIDDEGNIVVPVWFGSGTVAIGKVEPWKVKRLRGLQEKHYFAGEYIHASESGLDEFLSLKGIGLVSPIYNKYPRRLLDATGEVYEALPEHHLSNGHLETISLGFDHRYHEGAYYDPEKKRIALLSMLINGSRRNYVGVLLHETGHVFHWLVRDENPKDAKDLEDCFRATGTGYWIDYGPEGREERRRHAEGDAKEQIAEFYLAYVSQGRELLLGFISQLEGKEQEIWKEIYDIFKRNFKGREY